MLKVNQPESGRAMSLIRFWGSGGTLVMRVIWEERHNLVIATDLAVVETRCEVKMLRQVRSP
jgi:hypothetical protein